MASGNKKDVVERAKRILNGESGRNSASGSTSSSSGTSTKKSSLQVRAQNILKTNQTPDKYRDASEYPRLMEDDLRQYSGDGNADAPYRGGQRIDRAIGGLYGGNAGWNTLKSGDLPGINGVNGAANPAIEQIAQGIINDSSPHGHEGAPSTAAVPLASGSRSDQYRVLAQSGQAWVLDDIQQEIERLKEEGAQPKNLFQKIFGGTTYSNQDEIDAAEKRYEEIVRMLRLAGMEDLTNQLTESGNLGLALRMINYPEDQFYKDLKLVGSALIFGYDKEEPEFPKAMRRLEIYVGGNPREVIARDGIGQWTKDMTARYEANMSKMDDFIDRNSAAAGTEYDFTAEDYFEYLRGLKIMEARKIKLAEEAQKIQDKWGDLEKMPDYADYAKYQPSAVRDTGYYDEYGNLDWRAQVYDLVAAGADRNLFEEAVLELDPHVDYKAREYIEYGLQYMTDTDRKCFFYLFNSPEHGPDEALEYLDDISWNTMRQNTEEYQRAIEKAVDGDWKAAVASAIAAPFYGAMNSISGLNTIAGKAMGKSYHEYDPSFLYGTFRDTTVNTVGDKIAESTPWAPEIFGQNIFRVGYNAANSAAESFLNMKALGRAGSVSMGLDAFNSSYQRGFMDGKSDTDAFIDALVDGGIEVGIEAMSIDALMSDPGNPLGYFLKKTIAEGMEEGIGTVARMGYDEFKYGLESAINTRTSELVVMGYDPTDARKTAWKEWLNKLALDVTTGTLSSSMLSAPEAIQSQVETVQTGRTLQRNATAPDYEGFLKVAGTLDLTGEAKRAYDSLRAQWEQQQSASGEPQAAATGTKPAETEASGAAIQAETQAQAAKPAQRPIPPLSAAKLGLLYRESMRQLDGAARNALRQNLSFNVAKELVSQGVRGEEAKRLAESILRIQDGNFTPEDVKAVSGNAVARSVLIDWTATERNVNVAPGRRNKLANQ